MADQLLSTTRTLTFVDPPLPLARHRHCDMNRARSFGTFPSPPQRPYGLQHADLLQYSADFFSPSPPNKQAHRSPRPLIEKHHARSRHLLIADPRLASNACARPPPPPLSYLRSATIHGTPEPGGSIFDTSIRSTPPIRDPGQVPVGGAWPDAPASKSPRLPRRRCVRPAGSQSRCLRRAGNHRGPRTQVSAGSITKLIRMSDAR